MERRASTTDLGTRPRAGSVLVETLIAVSLFTVVILSSMAMVQSGRRFSSSTMQITTVEDLAQQMLFRMEHELATATGAIPKFTLPEPVAASDTAGMTVSSTLGFPPRGELLLDRGTAREERVRYASIASTTRFADLTRGRQCTTAADHPGNDGVDQLWVGVGEPLANQIDPGPDEYDGIALESGVRVFFRGDGTGFSYRVPVDPTGGTTSPPEDAGPDATPSPAPDGGADAGDAGTETSPPRPGIEDPPFPDDDSDDDLGEDETEDEDAGTTTAKKKKAAESSCSAAPAGTSSAGTSGGLLALGLALVGLGRRRRARS